jgi:hypothetical protein
MALRRLSWRPIALPLVTCSGQEGLPANPNLNLDREFEFGQVYKKFPVSQHREETDNKLSCTFSDISSLPFLGFRIFSYNPVLVMKQTILTLLVVVCYGTSTFAAPAAQPKGTLSTPFQEVEFTQN